MIEELLKERDYLPLFSREEEKTDPALWEQRRKELRALLAERCYGAMPEKLGEPTATLLSAEDCGFAFPAEKRSYSFSVVTPKGNYEFPLTVYVPMDGKKHRVLEVINYRDQNINKLNYEQILGKGLACAVFCYLDVVPDRCNSDFTLGMAAHFIDVPADRKRAANAPGKITLWGYAASRVLDWMYTQPELDADHTAVFGHSRLGKTALWTAANDERFRCVISNDSGFGGAACAKHGTGERVSNFVRCGSVDWFCENFLADLDAEDDRIYDQHFLLSLIAPRFMCVGSATEDFNADPTAEYLTSISASRAWKIYGKTGLIHPDRLPVGGDVFGEGEIQYHFRVGKHGVMPEDWVVYLDFLEKNL